MPFGKERKVSLEERGTGQASSLAQCPPVSAAALCSRRFPSSVSAGVIALTAECKSYTRSGEIKREGELLL